MRSTSWTKRSAVTLMTLSVAAAWLVPGAAASLDAATQAAAPAPEALERLADLLRVKETCGTYLVDADTVLESWEGHARDGAWTRAVHNGEEVPTEMLERAIFEAEGESWADLGRVAAKCAKPGGSCFRVWYDVFTGAAYGCVACCGAGTTPYCHVDLLAPYAACGCAT